MEEYFPTVSLDDDFCMEESVPERHLCIHEDAQHDLCPLSMSIQLKLATPHSGRCAVHISQ